MEEEIVDFNVGCETVIFQNIIRHSFEISEAWVATSRLEHHLLAWHGWWLVLVKERKDFIPSWKYVEPRNLLDVFPQSIVISFIHYQYT